MSEDGREDPCILANVKIKNQILDQWVQTDDLDTVVHGQLSGNRDFAVATGFRS